MNSIKSLKANRLNSAKIHSSKVWFQTKMGKAYEVQKTVTLNRHKVMAIWPGMQNSIVVRDTY
jgi:hypothetical protein